MSKEDPNSLNYTTPLFIQHQFLASGHNAKTPSATGTFVKFQGKHYVVTCQHVLAAADVSQRMNLSIVIGRGVFNLSHPTPDGIVPSFRVPIAEMPSNAIDIGISTIEHAWDFIVERKGKKAVDLDQWVCPDWSQINAAKACGWLDNYKKEREEQVEVSGVEVICEMASIVSPNHTQFTMHSATDEENHPSLSGISGGVIVTLDDAFETPFGLVFEGYPGAPGTGGSADTYLQTGDLMVRGHVLTPTVFAKWLSSLA